MFLKEIEMQGFKSFADKTKVEFDRGVTAVVGPNGSGKSNITESLRWALGESSAKSLRGGKMPDIIFAGTEKRSPLNFAQVAVVLDNSDGFISNAPKEIRVERHIYRNGDSDYLIAGKKVRLRDIHDLFLDTGLGRDSFSIISQGRVEEIFNSKPEERRAIFEEAAGVLKYKTRKKETKHKLDQTQANVDRLDDIVYELETQLAPLAKQAEVARQFQSLEAKRKQAQLDLLVYDITGNQAKQAELAKNLANLQAELKEYYLMRESLEAKHQHLKQKRQQLQSESEEKQANLLQLTKRLGDCERQIELITLDSHQKAEKRQESSQRLAQLEQNLAALQTDQAAKQAQLTELSRQLTAIQAQVASLTDEVAKFAGDPDQLIEQLREDYVQLMKQEADLSNQLTVIQSELATEEASQEERLSQEQQVRARVEDLEADNQERSTRLKACQAQVQTLLDQYQQLTKTIEQEQSHYQTAQQDLFNCLDDKKAKQAKKASLEAIQKNHSQFYAGVRAVLQEAASLGGILGAVSEHLTFEPRYQTALEIALGASSQHIIVADEASAKRAINYLKQKRLGRATFLPLTTLKERHLADHHQAVLAKSPGYLGTAQELVSYSSDLSAIFANLLGTTAIFDQVDHANKAAKALRYAIRIVTLDGTELRPGGSFSGGSLRQNNTTFIKPELDQITNDLTKLETQLRQHETLVEKLQTNLQNLSEQQQKVKEQGEQARLELQKAEFNQQQTQEQLTEAKALLAMMNQQHTNQTSDTRQKQKEKTEQALQTIQEQKTQLTQAIDQIKNDKTALNAKKAELTQQLAESRLQERDLQNEQRYETSNLVRLETDIEQVQAEILALNRSLSQASDEHQADQLPELKAKAQAVSERKTAEEMRLVQLRIEQEDYQAQIEELEEKLQQEQQKNEAYIRQQTKWEADNEQISQRLKQAATTLSEDFQLTFEEAKSLAQAISEPVAAKESLRHLQKAIKNLGPINLDAIAQYDEVSQRLNFLNSQKADLLKARDMLLSTIEEMDSEVKARFKVTFEAIRQSFKETFKQMFGGGSADLILTEKDLLASGVEISVQPPGKKIQSLNLMSGGEKALSALALLFAIIRVKTIPFVILDEVEAALDEANVKRFGDYLNRFDKDSQFIVVTHRKGTMAAADSIYGVTMQESGVSKIVSVKLKESQELDYVN
ncbi:chromosome segregation protein SMC [Streptococcus halichoeri]|uniref:chromosome segregation protein SMC n=1 Tax=Streptococcus halichoeri TaxID=254785 RepID=UPI001356C1D7|nr:chromosome segregation protein SMC [Streptococcus halichoeri]